MKTIEERRTEEVMAKVNALSNLTDAQRATVLEIALSHAKSHSLAFNAKTGEAINAPHYNNIADHVRFSRKQ